MFRALLGSARVAALRPRLPDFQDVASFAKLKPDHVSWQNSIGERLRGKEECLCLPVDVNTETCLWNISKSGPNLPSTKVSTHPTSPQQDPMQNILTPRICFEKVLLQNRSSMVTFSQSPSHKLAKEPFYYFLIHLVLHLFRRALGYTTWFPAFPGCK